MKLSCPCLLKHRVKVFLTGHAALLIAESLAEQLIFELAFAGHCSRPPDVDDLCSSGDCRDQVHGWPRRDFVVRDDRPYQLARQKRELSSLQKACATFTKLLRERHR